jgi:hypothetical protein
MATTTNYSWSTPDDTALVKDGAAAIRSLGTAIDTTVFTNAGAAIAKATVDAKGDLIAGTADNTVARLAVGTDGHTLVANSATATGLEWAAPASGGGMTSLATGSLSSLSTLDLTSINQGYIHLQLVLIDWELSADSNVYLRVNNQSANNYFMSGRRGTNTSGGTTTTALFSKNTDSLVYLTGAQADAGNYRNLSLVNVFNYTSAIFAFGDIKSQSELGSGDREIFDSQWSFDNTSNNAPITELNLLLDTGNFTNGTYVLYGVK